MNLLADSDPRARAELKELITELGRMGKIVIVSSHILPELADFCNTVGIIERGNLVACGSVSEITRQLQKSRIVTIRLLERAHEAASFCASSRSWAKSTRRPRLR